MDQASDSSTRTARVVVIGGTGHIGTYLIPRLVHAGYDVISVSRGERRPYVQDPLWDRVDQVQADRSQEEAAGTFGDRIAALQPDVVIDLICFEPASAAQLVEALRGQVQHVLHCGTLWVYGHSTEVPATENQPRQPFGEYGRKKAATESYLLTEARRLGFPVTILHPGHFVGPGWMPVNPAGNLNPEIFSRLKHGDEVTLPNLGMETVHHVHVDDIAHAFMCALAHRSVALGESFHVVSPAALTLRGYAEAVAAWFNQPARLRFLPWDEWCRTVSEDDAAKTWDHIAHSPNASITKAERLLAYHPRYRSLEAIREALTWLIRQGIVT
jgi:nucleoside-diphosphate-sugar epimerase